MANSNENGYMVSVAERLRRKVVALVYAGSNPVGYPFICLGGGIGRHGSFRHYCESVKVRVLSEVQF